MTDTEWKLKILGTFELVRNGMPTQLPRGNLRWLFASLVLEEGQAVPERRLTEQIWGPDGASSAALHSAVSRLRSWLEDTGVGARVAIHHTGTGYRMAAAELAVDAGEFLQLCDAAAELEGEVRLGQLAAALALWREPALADAPSELRHHPTTGYLDHRRSRAVLDLVATARALSRAAEVMETVRLAARDLPYDEPLQAALIGAANEAGIGTEAVRHFGVLRRRLDADLGTAPSPAVVQALHTASPAPETRRPAAHRPGPGLEPPRPVNDFTGRSPQMTRILDALADAAGPAVYVSGAPGIGKTELCLAVVAAVRTMRNVRVLYAAMEASADVPTAPLEALDRLSRAMGSAHQTDGDPTRLADRYQFLLAQYSTLLVLDDVEGARQIEPLLPWSPNCRVLINGRPRALAVPGLERVDLCPFEGKVGRNLLAVFLKASGTECEPGTLDRIVESVDGHPLALRVVALRAAAYPHRDLQRVAERLRDPDTRLDELSHDGLSVRQMVAGVLDKLPFGLVGELLAIRRAAVRLGVPDGAWVPLEQMPEVSDRAVDELVAKRILLIPQACATAAHGPLSVRLPRLVESALSEIGLVRDR